jgi:hypothetical protein
MRTECIGMVMTPVPLVHEGSLDLMVRYAFDGDERPDA